VNINGTDIHQLTDVLTGTVGGVVSTQKDPVVDILHSMYSVKFHPSTHSVLSQQYE
jgi:hypothetical protein